MAGEGLAPEKPEYVHVVNPGDFPAAAVTALLGTAAPTYGEELAAAGGVEKLLISTAAAGGTKRFFGVMASATRRAEFRVEIDGDTKFRWHNDLGDRAPMLLPVGIPVPIGVTVEVFATNLSDQGAADLMATLLMEP